MIYYQDSHVTIYHGDCREILPTLAAESVQCCVTSPPYFGLRDYGGSAQIGLEETPQAYVAAMTGVFEQVRRVLRDDATCWLNLGDSYAGSWGAQSREGYLDKGRLDGGSMLSARQIAAHPKGQMGTGSLKNTPGLKPKDLIGIPWRVAFALQEAGWWLRSDIIWSKGNPMPESVTDRPTKAHEYLFLLAKAERYFYDAEAIAEPSITNDLRRPYTSQGAWEMDGHPAEQRHGGELRGKGGKNAFRGQGHFREDENGPANRDGRDMRDVGAGLTRNRRSVWTVNTQPYAGAHFAVFPEKLIEPCILAGCPAQVCNICGAPWARMVERESNWQDRKAGGASAGNVGVSETYQNGVHGRGMSHDLGPKSVHFVGWQPTCSCNAGTPPGTVLDIFGGSGTTARVAKRLGRRAILIEQNEAYCEMAAASLVQQAFDLAVPS